MTAICERVYALTLCAVLLGLFKMLPCAFPAAIRFSGGLLLIMCLLRPLERDGMLQISSFEVLPSTSLADVEEMYRDVYDSARIQDIEKRTSEYIEKRAYAFGANIRAEVRCELRNAVPVPVSVCLIGTENAALSDWIQENIGIKRINQEWRGGD